ncbi:hypothetical protein PIB30_029402 [Stylosanthes scabra]|uniref:RRM domain-containing protein n=1 Tax=Stylosanthes scabra TaxID=79078 RepID=A0ABU6VEC0_9FABA|nr:hypothetical protein [Stylosanthes scabra]
MKEGEGFERRQGEGSESGEWREVVRRRSSNQLAGNQLSTHYGNQVHRQWRRMSERGRKVGEHGGRSVTVFADKLPSNSTVAWLWSISGGAGKVIDVYPSRKKRRLNPLLFAFVRFTTEKDAQTAIQRLNGWEVWGCKIRISRAKYERKWDEMQQGGIERKGYEGIRESTHE